MADYDFYIDIVDIDSSGPAWRVTDLYLDVEVRDKRSAQLVDIGEFVAAVSAGLLPPELAANALQSSYQIVSDLAGHGYDISKWAESRSLSIRWQDKPYTTSD